MNFKKIIQNIDLIYSKYSVPTNIQKHMIRVAAVCELICNKPKPKINSNNLVAVSLIHDIANIIKADFLDKTKLKLLEKKDKKRIDFFKLKQLEFWEKYGEDDNRANEKIARELKVNKRMIYLLENKRLVHLSKEQIKKDLELLIFFYADQRVSPKGVVSLKKRTLEYIKRNRLDKNQKKMKKCISFLEFSKNIEKEIILKTKIKPKEINDKSIKKYLKNYSKEMKW